MKLAWLALLLCGCSRPLFSTSFEPLEPPARSEPALDAQVTPSAHSDAGLYP